MLATDEVLRIYRETLPACEWGALNAWSSTFYPFQLRWMLERAKRAACVKARQIGWSHTTAGNGTLWGAFHGELTTIVSKGEQESKEVLEKARLHASVLEALGSKFARVIRSSATEIRFASGGRVLALPSSGGRGYTGNLILDEFAYHQHAKDTWDAAVPAMRLGDFRLRVISTPNGVGNEYANLIKAIRSGVLKRYQLHEVTIHQAMADGFPVSLEECWADAKGDPRLFSQLYEGGFLDGELQYIPTEAIKTEESAGPLTGYAFAGLDIGRSIDLTALYVVQGGIDQRLHVVFSETCKRTNQADIDRMVDAAFARFNIRRLCVDSTGIGAFPADAIQRRHGRGRVEPVTFTLQSKEELATALYTGFVGDHVRIPAKDRDLFDDLCSIQRIITDAGNVRYEAPHTDSGHADRAWALALALYAASQQPRSRAQQTGTA